MNVRVFAILLLAAGMLSAQMTVTGYLFAGPNEVMVDSTYFEYGEVRTWFMTPEWGAMPGEADTFEFPTFPGFPAIIKIPADFGGIPMTLELYRPIPGTWYPFPEPFMETRVQFTSQVGLEEQGALPSARFAVVPNVIRESAVIRSPVPGRLEVFDAAGNAVRTLAVDGTARWAADDDAGRRLAEGVYFCRLVTDEGSSVRKVLVAQR